MVMSNFISDPVTPGRSVVMSNFLSDSMTPGKSVVASSFLKFISVDTYLRSASLEEMNTNSSWCVFCS